MILGLGSPAALQLRVTGSFFLMRTDFGCSMIRGGRTDEEEEDEDEDELDDEDESER